MDKTGVLHELPRVGRTVPEVGDDNVRELSLYTYRILYEINGQDIYILAVAHKRQELKAGEIPRQP